MKASITSVNYVREPTRGQKIWRKIARYNTDKARFIQEVFIECLLQVDIGLRARGTEVSDEWKKSQLVTPAAISVPNLDFS